MGVIHYQPYVCNAYRFRSISIQTEPYKHIIFCIRDDSKYIQDRNLMLRLPVEKVTDVVVAHRREIRACYTYLTVNSGGVLYLHKLGQQLLCCT